MFEMIGFIALAGISGWAGWWIREYKYKKDKKNGHWYPDEPA